MSSCLCSLFGEGGMTPKTRISLLLPVCGGGVLTFIPQHREKQKKHDAKKKQAKAHVQTSDGVVQKPHMKTLTLIVSQPLCTKVEQQQIRF